MEQSSPVEEIPHVPYAVVPERVYLYVQVSAADISPEESDTEQDALIMLLFLSTIRILYCANDVLPEPTKFIEPSACMDLSLLQIVSAVNVPLIVQVSSIVQLLKLPLFAVIVPSIFAAEAYKEPSSSTTNFPFIRSPLPA